MNFLGHVHVARVDGLEPAFLLGTMLPDFASMAGGRLAAADEPRLAAGIAHHHRTDEAFHGAPDFVRLCVETSAELEARGIGWGAARAAAHVGTELLLDGLLMQDPATCAHFLEALEAAVAPDVAPALRRVGAPAPRWDAVIARVRGYGLPTFYRAPDLVAERLVHILAARPRLAIEPARAPALVDVMRALRPRVEAAADFLVAAARRAHEPPARAP